MIQIPRTIVQFWAQNIIPEDVSRLMMSWRLQNPGWMHKLYNTVSAGELIREKFGPQAEAAFRSCRLPAMQSDLFRLAYISAFGGVYVDAATQCLRPLESWLAGGCVNIARKWHGGLWNGFFAAPQCAPFIRTILNEALTSVQNRRGESVWDVTGPGILNRLEKAGNIPEDIVIWPFEEFKKQISLINDLDHKRRDHWSTREKEVGIYIDCDTTTPLLSVREDWPLKKVCFHLGPHRTSTTECQIALEGREGGLKARAISLFTVRSTLAGSYKAWRDGYTRTVQRGCLEWVSMGAPAKAELLCSLRSHFRSLRQLMKNSPLALISDENILGPALGQKYAGSHVAGVVYPLAPLIFDAIRAEFEDVDFKIFMVHRDYGDWLQLMPEPSSDASFGVSLSDEQLRRDYLGMFSEAQRVFGDNIELSDFSDCFSADGLATKLANFFEEELDIGE